MESQLGPRLAATAKVGFFEAVDESMRYDEIGRSRASDDK